MEAFFWSARRYFAWFLASYALLLGGCDSSSNAESAVDPTSPASSDAVARADEVLAGGSSAVKKTERAADPLDEWASVEKLVHKLLDDRGESKETSEGLQRQLSARLSNAKQGFGESSFLTRFLAAAVELAEARASATANTISDANQLSELLAEADKLYEQGRFRRAVTNLEKCAEIGSRLNEAWSVQKRLCEMQLARAQFIAGFFDDALATCDATLPKIEKAFGKEHPWHLCMRVHRACVARQLSEEDTGVASSLNDVHRLSSDVRLQERAFFIGQAVCGTLLEGKKPENVPAFCDRWIASRRAERWSAWSETSAHYWAAMGLFALQRVQDAKSHTDKALRSLEQVDAEDCPLIYCAVKTACLGQHSRAALHAKDRAAAKRYRYQAWEVLLHVVDKAVDRAKKIPPDDANLRRVALSDLMLAVSAMRSFFGETHPYTFNATQVWASVLADCGELDKAISISADAAEKIGDAHGFDSAIYGLALQGLAVIEVKRAKNARTLKLVDRSIEVLHEAEVQATKRHCAALTDAAANALILGERERAAKYAADASVSCDRLEPGDVAYVAYTRWRTATALLAAGEKEKGRREAVLWCAALDRMPEMERDRMLEEKQARSKATVDSILKVLYRAQLEVLLQGQEHVYGGDDKRLDETLRALAEKAKQDGDEKVAEDYLQRAAKLKR